MGYVSTNHINPAIVNYMKHIINITWLLREEHIKVGNHMALWEMMPKRSYDLFKTLYKKGKVCGERSEI